MKGRTHTGISEKHLEKAGLKLRLSNPRFLRSVFATLVFLSLFSFISHGQAFGKGSTIRDGRLPAAGLIVDNKGNLYGTTEIGGAGGGQGDGTVFELTPTGAGGWSESILWSFNGTDGQIPASRLVMDTDSGGNLLALYGTTINGGTSGDGTMFGLNPPAKSGGSWTESTLFSFDVTDGSLPGALIMDNSGYLYGTTQSGGANGDGTVFELTPTKKGTWKESILLSLAGSSDGEKPRGALVLDGGNLYGTTQTGGPDGAGTVFELTPQAGGSWKEVVLWSFDGADGSDPGALITDNNSNLYSMTANGGTSNDGTVFELTTETGGSWSESILHNFVGTDGATPEAGLIMDTDGNLLGTTNGGGAHGDGTVFELTPNGAATDLYDFGNNGAADGRNPVGLTMIGGNLYGTTYEGGTYGGGTVFELTPTTSGVTTTWTESVLYNFDGPAL
jgi:uncharacterized repeat protein (TIGR03803 family)